MNKKLSSQDQLTALIRSEGLLTWNELLNFVSSLPYGRNSNRTDFSLVILEKKGSCSSKHSLLKKVADLNNINNVKLILAIYKMNNSNTSNIGTSLFDNDLDFLPEAHCYLKINGNRVDTTTQQSTFDKLKNDIIQELEIEPEQVTEFKVEYHQQFLRNWITENNINFSFEDIWKIREQCIQNLTKSN